MNQPVPSLYPTSLYLLVVVVLVGWLVNAPSHPTVRWILPFVAGGLFVLVAVELLIRNLPRAIRRTMVGNAYRSNGTVSSRRLAVERKAIGSLRMSLLVAGFLLIIPLCGVSAWLLTGPGAAKFLGVPELAILETEKTGKPLSSNGPFTTGGSEILPDESWDTFPGLAIGSGLVVWMAISFVIFRSRYLRGLKELWRNSLERQQYYETMRLSHLPRSGRPSNEDAAVVNQPLDQ